MRWIALFLGMIVPLGAVGFVVTGPHGAAVAVLIVLLLLAWALLRAERIIVGLHELKPGKRGASGYRVIIFRDPTPSAFVARSLLGRGTILLSQGLVALLDDQELRQIVESAGHRLKSRSVLLQSVCAVMAIWVLRIAPYGWSHLALSSKDQPIRSSDSQSFSPASALHFVILYPMIRFILCLGSPRGNEGNLIGLDTDASRKLAQARQIWESPVHPGISALSIV